MILGMVMAGAIMFFRIERDRFDDKKTYVAQMGNGSGVSLRVECGALTDNKMAVRITADRYLYSNGFRGVARYPDRVRFDERPAMEIGFHYIDKDAIATGVDALDFISYLKRSKVVAVELTDYRNDEFYISFPISNAAESIGEVETSCRNL